LRQPSEDQQHILQLYTRNSKRPSKFKLEHQELIRDFLEKHQHRKVTLKQMKKALLDKHPELAPISNTSIGKILRKGLNYSYKKASQRALPVLTDNNKRHHLETAFILEGLRSSGVRICFIDEYNVSEEDACLYTWLPKGK